MAKKKFNFVDVLIVLFVLAIAVGGIKVLSGKEGNVTTAVKDVSFTVEVAKSDKTFADAIKIGDDIYDSKKGGYYGKVTNVDVKPAKAIGANTTEGKYVMSEFEGKYNVYITVSGTPTTVTDGNIMFAGQKVKVGEEMFLKSAAYVGYGYAVDVHFDGEAQ